jgi:hypothetical protein
MGAMFIARDHTLRLQFSVDRLVDLRAGVVVGRDDQCPLGRPGILLRNRRNALFMAFDFMDAALPL